MSDYIVRATAADASIRAFAITSRELVETARKDHNTSPIMTAALGRLLSGAAMMGVMLKGEKDLLTLQIQCSGPAEGIVESALDKVKMIEDMGYDNLVISIKSSDVMMCVKAHELIASKTEHPLHVGITEAGTLISGNIKSSIGLGLILSKGIGDTIRVSLTGDPIEEIKSAKLILRTLGLRKGGIEVVSCPTCGRTQINLIQLANQVETMVAEFPLDIKVAVMGCVVNGPGEAKEADLGVAGGIGEGLIIKHGKVFKKVPEEELLPALRYELEHWSETNVETI